VSKATATTTATATAAEFTETTERAETADRPADKPVSVRSSRLRNSKAEPFGVDGTLCGAGAVLVRLMRSFRRFRYPC
jgi:hypothetical protein